MGVGYSHLFHPNAIYHYPDFDGEMYHVANQHVDLDVTMNHRMWVSQTESGESYGFEKAEDIVGKSRRYKKDASWTADDYQFVLPAVGQHGEKPLNMESWLAFFGNWITKGWIDQNLIVCSCHPDVIESLGFKMVNENENLHYILDEQLYHYLTTDILPRGDGGTGCVPPWSLSQKQARHLIRHMQNESYSAKLAGDLQRLCLHAGWSADIQQSDEKYLVSINQTTNNNISTTTEEVYHYQGSVYCLGVPSEVFYVRHNGRPVWTGNSRESGPVQLLTRQPTEGRNRQGGGRVGEMERDVLVAYGCSSFLKEKMTDSSDLFRMFVSKQHQTFCVGNEKENLFKFNEQYLDSDDVREIQLPYAMKLLWQEITSMGIDMRLIVD